MNYLLIFFFKLLENTLSTLRLILVSNGKKILGSILLFLVSIVWIISSSIAIINLNIKMILVFSIGSLVGSYIGSLIEEKLALGNNILICISNNQISDNLRKEGYIITELENHKNQQILFIIIQRKKQKELIKKIRLFDNKAVIVSEYTNIY